MLFPGLGPAPAVTPFAELTREERTREEGLGYCLVGARHPNDAGLLKTCVRARGCARGRTQRRRRGWVQCGTQHLQGPLCTTSARRATRPAGRSISSQPGTHSVPRHSLPGSRWGRSNRSRGRYYCGAWHLEPHRALDQTCILPIESLSEVRPGFRSLLLSTSTLAPLVVWISLMCLPV